MYKKNGLLLFLALLETMTLVAQTKELKFAEAAGNYYRVYSEQGQEAALALAKEMDARFIIYNRLFRFTPSRLSQPLSI